MGRRFVLVGIFVRIDPGSIFQIILGTFFSTFYFFVQLTAHPFKNRADDFLAAACSFVLVLCFACCVILKYNSLLYVQMLAEQLSPQEGRKFLLSSNDLGIILLTFVLSAFILSTMVFLYVLYTERVRKLNEDLVSASRRLRSVAASKDIETPLREGFDFHLFLSHVWGTGQDQMRIVKQRLLEMMPDLRIFLDVDDLKEIGNLEGYIEQSEVVLIFCEPAAQF